MGAENSVDNVGGGHHVDAHAHALDGHDLHESDTHSDNEHCSHCCHGHTGSIANNTLTLSCEITGQQFAHYQPHFLNFSQAPPTPPPNA